MTAHVAAPSPPATAALDPLIVRIVGQASAIRRKHTTARVIGIYSVAACGTATDVESADGRYLVRPCPTPLAARMAVRMAARADAATDETTVIVTSLDATALGSDVVLRLAAQKLFSLDSWGIVRERFEAPRIDHRIHSQACLADWLVELSTGGDVPKAANGFLDADIAWPFVFNRALGMTEKSYDPVELLVWAQDSGSGKRWQQLSPDRRAAMRQWFTLRAGLVAAAMLESLDTQPGLDLVSLGLTLDCTHREAQAPDITRAQVRSQVRIEERYFGGRSPSPQTLRQWGDAAVRAVELHLPDERQRRETIRRADDIIRSIGAEPLAALSRISRIGFEQRLEAFGTALETAIDRPSPQSRTALREALRQLASHHEAVHDKTRYQRAEMAVRLVRWLADRAAEPATAPAAFAEAVRSHARDGGFVVWARDCLRSGEPLAPVEKAFTKLGSRVNSALDQDAGRFASLLAGWLQDGGDASDVIPVERILDVVVAPLAAKGPVLFIVIDGMSMALFRELMAGLTRSGWFLLAQSETGDIPTGIATVPSVTEFSRTSLLAGRLLPGSHHEERTEFERHPALVAASKKNVPPRLFHKADLAASGDGNLAESVRQEIRSPERRVVGVVINAVDDLLAKGEQVHVTWNLETLRHLPTLLHEAREADRTVILTSDHGHVLELASEYRSGGVGERYRSATAAAEDGEIVLVGSRVLAEGGRLVAAWRDQIRYLTGTKRGYHGGANPQEMIVPIGVLTTQTDPDRLPEGWDLVRSESPAWWDEPQRRADHEAEPPAVARPGTDGIAKPRLLFDPETGEVPKPRREPAVPRTQPWVPALLDNELFKAQRKLIGRAALSDTQVESFLTALTNRGGVMTTAALGRALELAPFRLTGLVALLGRVLNIDGFRVVGRSESADEITLDVALLKRQFGLASGDDSP
jgi:hypothetical protein